MGVITNYDFVGKKRKDYPHDKFLLVHPRLSSYETYAYYESDYIDDYLDIPEDDGSEYHYKIKEMTERLNDLTRDCYLVPPSNHADFDHRKIFIPFSHITNEAMFQYKLSGYWKELSLEIRQEMLAKNYI